VLLFWGRIEQNVNFRLLSYEEFANSKTFFAELGTISYVLKNRNGGNPIMIGTAVKELLLEKQETFLVPAENVANVMCLNPLSHAALVLSKVRYSKIPVLDKGDRFVGLIGLTDVVDKMFDLTSVDFEKLNEFTVADVMEVNVPVIGESWDL